MIEVNRPINKIEPCDSIILLKYLQKSKNTIIYKIWELKSLFLTILKLEMFLQKQAKEMKYITAHFINK